MSHPYISIVAGMERLRAGLDLSITPQMGIIPLIKYLEQFWHMALQRLWESYFCWALKQRVGSSFPVGGGWGCRARAGLKRCVVEVSHSQGFLVPRLSLIGFKQLLTERNGCQSGGWRGTWKTSQWSSNRASKGKLLSSWKTAFLLPHFIAL